MKKIKLYFIISITLIINSLAFAKPQPSTPYNVTAIAHNGQAVISFDTILSPVGIGTFTVTTYPGGATKDSLSTNIIITGLTNGVAYTFTVTAQAGAGQSLESEPSNEVTPCLGSHIPLAQSQEICGEGQITFYTYLADRLNANPNISYRWYDAPIDGNLLGTADTFKTETISTSKTYYLTMLYLGCESNTRQPIDGFVNVKPVIDTDLNYYLCDSGSTTLSVIAPGRIKNINKGTQYTWRDAQKNIVAEANEFTTPMLHETTIYSLTATNPGMCVSDTSFINVHVTHLDAPQLADSSRCGAGHITLSVINIPKRTNSHGNYEYDWYDGEDENANHVINSESLVIDSLTTTTSYYVELSHMNCTTSRTKVTATIADSIPKFTIEPTSITSCLGDTVSIISKATGGSITYYLVASIDGQPLGGAETDTLIKFVPEITFNQFTLKSYAFNACGMDSTDIYTIHVNFTDTLLTLDQTTLTANQKDATYQWINADTKELISDANDVSFTPTISGNYAVVITNNTCSVSDTSMSYFVDLTTTNIMNASNIQASVFPNPATNFVNINLTEAISGTVSITDINGNVVSSKIVNGSQLNISTSDLSSGVYVLKIASDTLNATKQLLIVK
jgi:hypothetical protein